MQQVMIASYRLLRERDMDRLREMIAADIAALIEPSFVRAYEPCVDGGLQPTHAQGQKLSSDAEEMEAGLLALALAKDYSMLSTHPRLDARLRPLAERCRAHRITTQVFLVRAHGRTHGAYAVHWIGPERPTYDRRSPFYSYWDNVGLAVAAAQERARIETELESLRERAYTDPLTGLPNQFALEEELRRHEQTTPFSVLALDFDGMKEANTAFKSYEEGGDVLIESLGLALPNLARDGEYAARMHTAGDEFALLLPGVDENAGMQRCRELEADLDGLKVPDTHQPYYHGASVGCATREGDETPGQVLGRAIEAMHQRKLARRDRRRLDRDL
jgi:diguanylate cyclase (GGDEF)-like protein